MKAQEGAQNNTRRLYYLNKFLSNLKLNSSQSAINLLRTHKKFRPHLNEVILENESANNTLTTSIEPTFTATSDYTTMYPITTPFQLTSSASNNTTATPIMPSTQYVNGTGQDISRPKKVNKSRRKVVWGAWHPWSQCSRSCGSGVMSQRRDCIR